MLHEMGGVCTRAQLVARVGRKPVDRALRAGSVVALARGRYALPQVEGALRVAHERQAVLCRQSAALHHGWAVKTTPDAPHISVPRNRHLTLPQRAGVVVHRDAFLPEDVDGPATSQEKTLDQCLRLLPFDEGLAIADSALREGVSPALLRRVAMAAQGTGAPQARRIVAEARAEAANPFESVLRAIALGVPGLRVRPQVWIGRDRPDLVDEDLRIVIEAESFEWHGNRAALRKDAARYNRLVVAGWLVLRFSWEDVMFAPEAVRRAIEAAVARRTGCTCGGCRCA